MARWTAGVATPLLAVAGSVTMTAATGAAAAEAAPAFADVLYLSSAEVTEQTDDDAARILAMIKTFRTVEPEGLLGGAVHRAMLRRLRLPGRANPKPR